MCRQFNGKEVDEPLPKLFCTVGIHPHEATRAVQSHSDTDAIAKELEHLIQANRDVVVAVGECGLDFDRNFSSHSDQKIIFALHLRLAQKLNMPLFFHERSAHDAFIAQIHHHKETHKNQSLPRGVVHCFTSGELSHLYAYLDLGFYIGITGWVCDSKRGAPLMEIVPSIPKDRIMIETDAPYLIPRNAPKSARRKGAKVNEPRLLPYVASKVAELYRVEVGEISRWTIQNVERLFGIPVNDNVALDTNGAEGQDGEVAA
ncbi:hypothetical protein HK097_010279 [Rhizophlyctis rosea]|uniref:Uncharacterized protein n=1 Tax=Rhizophlyctis rosea TaxID=64517 RepID=A0AAD5SHH3_9FUNG|nr:hypothetical protein HK097_010279 [Rhizophlyctis rosea]